MNAIEKPSRMRWIVLVGIVVVVTLGCWWWGCPATTVVVLRHAEKANTPGLDDDLVPLTADGETRAETLALALARAGVTKIFVTEKLRTQQTAAPLAGATGLTPVQMPAADVGPLADAVQSWRNRGRVIVIVGHSDTVPALIDRLGGGTVTIAADEFDNLFVLTLRTWRPTRLIQATYGEPR